MPLRALCLLVCASAATSVSAQRLVDYAQLDATADGGSLVLVRVLGDPRAAAPDPVLTATASRWSDGQAEALSLLARHSLAQQGGHAVRGGAGVGLEHFDDRAGGERRSDPSLRLQVEADGPVGPHRYYLLAQASSFRRGAFVTGQLAWAGTPLTVALSRYTDRGYGATTATVQWHIARGWGLRLGAVRDDAGTGGLVGVSYNGF